MKAFLSLQLFIVNIEKSFFVNRLFPNANIEMTVVIVANSNH